MRFSSGLRLAKLTSEPSLRRNRYLVGCPRAAANSILSTASGPDCFRLALSWDELKVAVTNSTVTPPRFKPETENVAEEEAVEPLRVAVAGTAVAAEPLNVNVTCDPTGTLRSEEHTSELQSLRHLVCR